MDRTNKKNRNGYALTGVILAIAAAAILTIPITKWLLSMNDGTEDLQTRMAMQQILTDKWNIINTEEFEALDETIAAKGTSWTEQAGEGNRWTIQTDFGNKGKYVNTVCTNATPGADDRRCRQISIQITDSQTGKTQAVNLTKTDSRYLNSRMKKMEDSIASLTTAVNNGFASMQSNISSLSSSISGLSSRVASLEGKFGNYYTRAEVDNKVNSSGSFYRTTVRSYISYPVTADVPAKTLAVDICTGKDGHGLNSYAVASAQSSDPLCSFIQNGYNMPDSCYFLVYHNYQWEGDTATCPMICIGKNCIDG